MLAVHVHNRDLMDNVNKGILQRKCQFRFLNFPPVLIKRREIAVNELPDMQKGHKSCMKQYWIRPLYTPIEFKKIYRAKVSYFYKNMGGHPFPIPIFRLELYFALYLSLIINLENKKLETQLEAQILTKF